MKKYRISEICDILGGGTPKTTIPEYWNGDIPWLSVKDFNNDDAYVYETEKKITQEGLKHCSATLLEKDDIVISARGTVGALTLIPFPMTFNQSCYGLRGKRELVDKHYLFYKLKNSFQSFLANSHGSVFNTITRDTFNNICIQLPDLSEQQRIAKILSNIDAKIELNKKISRELEAMAKELYDYWFVQFDFPNEQGKPYKSSGGKMVWNETLKREIPEGWEVKSVNDISVSVRGVGYNKKDEKSFKDDNVVLILRGNNIADNHIVYDDNTVYIDKSFVSPEQVIHKFDLIMTMSSGSKDHVGKSAMFLFDSPHSYGAFCNKITPDIHCEFFLENYLHSEFYKKYIYQTCSGTGINNLTNEHLSHAVFPFPTRKTLHQFNQFVKEWYNNRGLLEQENNQLSGIRNQLLPLLMNGQVRVTG